MRGEMRWTNWDQKNVKNGMEWRVVRELGYCWAAAESGRGYIDCQEQSP